MSNDYKIATNDFLLPGQNPLGSTVSSQTTTFWEHSLKGSYTPLITNNTANLEFVSQNAANRNAVYTYDLGENGRIENIRRVLQNSKDGARQGQLGDISMTNGRPNLLLLANGADFASGNAELVYENGQLRSNGGQAYGGHAFFSHDTAFDTDGGSHESHFRFDMQVDGSVIVNIEDLAGMGDRDFNDMTLKITGDSVLSANHLFLLEGLNGPPLWWSMYDFNVGEIFRDVQGLEEDMTALEDEHWATGVPDDDRAVILSRANWMLDRIEQLPDNNGLGYGIYDDNLESFYLNSGLNSGLNGLRVEDLLLNGGLEEYPFRYPGRPLYGDLIDFPLGDELGFEWPVITIEDLLLRVENVVVRLDGTSFHDDNIDDTKARIEALQVSLGFEEPEVVAPGVNYGSFNRLQARQDVFNTMREEALDSFSIGSMQDFFYYRASAIDSYVSEALTLADTVLADVEADLAQGNLEGLDDVMNRLTPILESVAHLSTAPFQSGNRTGRANTLLADANALREQVMVALAESVQGTELDGTVSGSQSRRRNEDATQERHAILWKSLVNSLQGNIPLWDAEQTFAFTLGFVLDANVEVPDATWDAFFAANLDGNGHFTGDLDVSMFVALGLDASDVEDALEDASLLFYSLQQHREHGNSVPADAIILPGSNKIEDAQRMFIGALGTDIQNTSTSDFLTHRTGNVAVDTRNQEFLLTGFFNAEEILTGNMSEDTLANHALVQSMAWVGREVIEEMGDEWTGPSVAELDSGNLADYGTEGPGPYNIFTVAYTNDDGKQVSLTVSTAQADALYARSDEGEISNLEVTHLKDPIQTRLYWNMRALSEYESKRAPTYGENGQMTSGASAEVRLSHAFALLHQRYESAAVADQDYRHPLPFTSEDTLRPNTENISGTSLGPLLNVAWVDQETGASTFTPPTVMRDGMEVSMNDQEALDFMFNALGVTGDQNLGAALEAFKGTANIVEVTTSWASGRPNHPESRAPASHKEDAIVNLKVSVLAALEERGRLSDETGLVTDIADDLLAEVKKGERRAVIFAAVELGLLVFSAGLAAYAVLGAEVVEGAAVVSEDVMSLQLADQVFAGSMSIDEFDVAQALFVGSSVVEPTLLATYGASVAAGGSALTAAGAGGYAVYYVNEEGVPIPDPRNVPDDDTFKSHYAGGLTPGEHRDAVNLALELSNIFHRDGAEAAAAALHDHARNDNPAITEQAVQLLPADTRQAIEAALDNLNNLFGDWDAALASPGIEDDIALLEQLSPSHGWIYLERLAANSSRPPDEIASVFLNLDSEVAARLLTSYEASTLHHENTGGADRFAEPILEGLLLLSTNGDGKLADIIGRMTDISSDTTAHMVLRVLASTGFEAPDGSHHNITGAADLLVGLDPEQSSEVLDDLLLFERQGHRRIPDGGTSVLSNILETTFADIVGAFVGQGGSASSIAALFVRSEILLPLDELGLLGGFTPEFGDDVKGFVDNPLYLYEALGEDEEAADIAAKGFNELSDKKAAMVLIDNSVDTTDAVPLEDIVILLRKTNTSHVADIFTEIVEENPDVAANILNVTNSTIPDSILPDDGREQILEWFRAVGPSMAGELVDEMYQDAYTESELSIDLSHLDEITAELISNMTPAQQAKFLGAMSPENAARILLEAGPSKAATILEGLAEAGAAALAAELLAALSDEDAAEIVKRMSYQYAARVLEALGAERAGQILAQMTPNESAPIIATMGAQIVIEIFDLIEDYERKFEILMLAGVCESCMAAVARGVGLGPYQPVPDDEDIDPDAGIVSPEEYEEIDQPAIIYNDQTTIGGRGEVVGGGLFTRGQPVIVVDVGNPENENIITQGLRRIVRVMVDGRDPYFAAVDQNGEIIPGYLVGYDLASQEWTAFALPDDREFDIRIRRGTVLVGQADQTISDLFTRLQDSQAQFQTEQDPNIHQGELPFVFDGVHNLYDNAGFEQPAPNPLPGIRAIINAENSDLITQGGAQYLLYLVDYLTPAQEDYLSAQEVVQILRLAHTHSLAVGPDTLRILGTHARNQLPSGGSPEIQQLMRNYIDTISERVIAEQLDNMMQDNRSEQDVRDLINGLITIASEEFDIRHPPTLVVAELLGPLAGATLIYTAGNNTITITPAAFEALRTTDKIHKFSQYVIHEMTHAWQSQLRADLRADVLTPGTSQHDLALLLSASTDFARQQNVDGVTSPYYRRLWHEDNAYFVGDTVAINIMEHLNSLPDSDVTFMWIYNSNGALLTDVTTGDEEIGDAGNDDPGRRDEAISEMDHEEAAAFLLILPTDEAALLLAALEIEDASPIVLAMGEDNANLILALIDSSQADLIRFGVNVDRVESTIASISADMESGAIGESLAETLLNVMLNAVNAYIEELPQYTGFGFDGALASYSERLLTTKDEVYELLGIPTEAEVDKFTLSAGEEPLSIFHRLESANGDYRTAFVGVGEESESGNFVILDNMGHIVWNADVETSGRMLGSGFGNLELTEDGGLEIVDGDGELVWTSHTEATNASGKYELQLTDDGALVLIDANAAEGQQLLWSSDEGRVKRAGSSDDILAEGGSLSRFGDLRSSNGQYTAEFFNTFGSIYGDYGPGTSIFGIKDKDNDSDTNELVWSLPTVIGRFGGDLILDENGVLTLVKDDFSGGFEQDPWVSGSSNGPGDYELQLTDQGQLIIWDVSKNSVDESDVWASPVPEASSGPTLDDEPDREYHDRKERMYS